MSAAKFYRVANKSFTNVPSIKHRIRNTVGTQTKLLQCHTILAYNFIVEQKINTPFNV